MVKHFLDLARSIAVLLAIVLTSLWMACGAEATPTPTAVPATGETLSADQIIVLGDVDPDEPSKKIKRFQPLADYLARHLIEYGIEDGQVVVARDIEEMGRLLKDGSVDIYFDSPFPTLAVQELASSEIILRRWKEGLVSYWSTYITLHESDITRVEDFASKILAFEEPRSTSGFLLPAGTLVQRGFSLREVKDSDAAVAPDEIGYFFSGDEENTVELLLRGQVAGGGISNEDYAELSPELKEKIVAFDRTLTVPRQLVSVRPGLDPSLSSKVRELLIGLDQTDEGRQILDGLKQTVKFDPVPAEAEAALLELQELIRLVSEE